MARVTANRTHVSVQLKPEVYELFKLLAERDGMESVSTWMRGAIYRNIQRELNSSVQQLINLYKIKEQKLS